MLKRFELHEPRTVGEASQMMAHYGPDAAYYAGGTELLFLMKEGLAHFPHLINLKTIAGLDGIRLEPGEERLHIGPLATHHQLEHSRLVHQHAQLLARVEARVANVRVRSAGTLGGNLCFADPRSDPATLLLAWGAELELSSADGRRRLLLDDFLRGLYTTALGRNEILTDIRLSLLPRGMRGAYLKFATHERPTASVASFLTIRSGIIAEARLAAGSVGPRPRRLAGVEGQLLGQPATAALFRDAAEAAGRAVEPVDDFYGTAPYKRNLVRVLAERTLRRAAGLTLGENDVLA